MRRKESIEVILDDEEDKIVGLNIGMDTLENSFAKSMSQDDSLEAIYELGETHAEEQLSCSICLENFETGDCLAWSTELRCMHVFHSNCLTPWLMTNDDCPICRTSLIKDSDYEVNESAVKNLIVKSIDMRNGMIAAIKERGTLLFKRSRDEDNDEHDLHLTCSDAKKDIEMVSMVSGEENVKKKNREKRKRRRRRKQYSAINSDDGVAYNEPLVDDNTNQDIEWGRSGSTDNSVDGQCEEQEASSS